MPARGASATYAYDARGRRVERAAGGEVTIYHYDQAGRVIAETDPSGAKIREYFYLGGRLLATDACSPSGGIWCRQWYHTDHLGSIVARTNAAGGVVAQIEYGPWGEQWSLTPSGAVGGDRQYNGRVFDPGTGFHDYGARMYWPEIGRFISADSVMGSPASPMTLNRYSYVLNNPYKYVDPTGRETQAIIVHSKVAGMDVGYHAAIRVDNGGGGQPVLFDPGGSYSFGREPRGSGGFFEGEEASLEAFVKWQASDGDKPFVYRFNTTPEEEAQIAKNFGYKTGGDNEAHDPGAGDCSKAVSNAISGVGPFKKVSKGTRFPGNLEDDLKKAQKEASPAPTPPPDAKKQP